jgi:hypothetical protein
VKASKDRLEQVVIEMNQVTRELADAHGDTMESDRQRKRYELVESLKRIFPDRVVMTLFYRNMQIWWFLFPFTNIYYFSHFSMAVWWMYANHRTNAFNWQLLKCSASI